jgi:hypothetical protein
MKKFLANYVLSLSYCCQQLRTAQFQRRYIASIPVGWDQKISAFMFCTMMLQSGLEHL